MTIRFKALCSELHINPEYGDEVSLKIIEAWCHAHVSMDVLFHGNLSEKYSQYLGLARHYLDEFLAHIPLNFSEAPLFNNMSLIQYAAYQGYDHYINSLTVQKDFYNEGNMAGMTPLHLAALEGNAHTIEVLLNKGANPLKANSSDQLPIYSALVVPMLYEEDLIKKKERVFRILKIQAPETIMHTDKSGDTVFQLMAVNGFTILMAEVLKEDTQLAFYKNNFTHYPIHTAILNQQIDICRLLLVIPKVASLADVDKRVALHYAARYGTKDMVELCCKASTDLNIRDSYNKTPLILAAEAQNMNGIHVLIDHGADAALTDFEGNSILHYAVLSRNEEMVRWILDHTLIDINQTNSEGDSALSLAGDVMEYNNIKQLLIDRGAQQEELS
jgi:ankyrin repeat protein